MAKKTHGSLLKFSRGFWEQAVECKGCEPEILRHYDILKALADGKSHSQIAFRFGVYKSTVTRIAAKYR
jgi:hypothetical protein